MIAVDGGAASVSDYSAHLQKFLTFGVIAVGSVLTEAQLALWDGGLAWGAPGGAKLILSLAATLVLGLGGWAWFLALHEFFFVTALEYRSKFPAREQVLLDQWKADALQVPTSLIVGRFLRYKTSGQIAGGSPRLRLVDPFMVLVCAVLVLLWVYAVA